MTLFGYCNDEGKDKHRLELEATDLETGELDNIELSNMADTADETASVTVTPTEDATTLYVTPSASPSSTAKTTVEAESNSVTKPSSQPLSMIKPEIFITTVPLKNTEFANTSIFSILHNESSLNEEIIHQVTDVSNSDLVSNIVFDGDNGQLIFGLYACLVMLLQGLAFLYLFPNLKIPFIVLAIIDKAIDTLIDINEFV